MKQQTKAYLYALSAVLLWSTVATAFKLSLRHLSPEELLLFASFFSLLFFTFVLLVQKKLLKAWILFRSHWKVLLFTGIINPFVYYLVLFKAYELLPAQEAQAINYTWALMLTYLSVPLLKQTLTRKDVIAGLICYFGVVIIATRGDLFSMDFASIFGVVLALTSTVLWALYWIANTKVKADPIVLLFLNFLIGVVAIIIYVSIREIPISFSSSEGLLAAVYVGMFEMGLTFILWLSAMKMTESTAKVANLIFLSPILSLVFIYFIVGEEILPSTIVALGMILSGLWFQKRK